MIKEFYDLTPAERDAHAAKSGNFNTLPPNWREVDEKTYVQQGMRRVYSPRMVEFRQAVMTGLDGRDYYHDLNMDWFHDGTGSAYVFDYWQGKLRFFFFGCDHAYVETSRPAGNRSGIHTRHCPKCDHHDSYDTSD